jgi:hypothetical protein
MLLVAVLVNVVVIALTTLTAPYRIYDSDSVSGRCEFLEAPNISIILGFYDVVALRNVAS